MTTVDSVANDNDNNDDNNNSNNVQATKKDVVEKYNDDDDSKQQTDVVDTTDADAIPAPQSVTDMVSFLLGSWRGQGLDVFAGQETKYNEELVFSAIPQVFNATGADPTKDRQQIFGVQYRTKLFNVETGVQLHDESGYILFDVVEQNGIVHDIKSCMKVISIVRGISILATGSYVKTPAPPNEFRINLTAKLGNEINGILNNPVLNTAAQTKDFTWQGSLNLTDWTFGYAEDSTLVIPGMGDVKHTDANTLKKVPIIIIGK
jgi:hypothetical protein